MWRLSTGTIIRALISAQLNVSVEKNAAVHLQMLSTKIAALVMLEDNFRGERWIICSQQRQRLKLDVENVPLLMGSKTTKELVDAGFKMPKVMKDMANSLLLKYPGLAHDVHTVGLYIGGEAMQLFCLDFPAGYVARLDGFGPMYFPTEENNICFALPSLLQLVLSSRQLMEEMQGKIQDYKTVKPISRIGVVPKQIVPTFTPSAVSVQEKKRQKKRQKKRKVNE